MLTHSILLALAALSTSTLAQISDDFENGWDKSTWPIYAPDCNQGGSVSLDSTTAHSGKNSMKVVGGSNGYCGHIFFGTTEVPSGDDVYVRTWLKHEDPLTDAHVTFIVMPDSGLGANEHLRVSGQMEIIEYNRESDDATLPDLSSNGVASSVGLPTDTWECFEYHLGSDGTIETWLNGKEVPGLTVGPGITNSNANGWGSSYKPKIQGVYFGWESYSGTTDTFWYDDVAIASTRVGCSSSGASSRGDAGTSAAKTSDVETSSSIVAATSSASIAVDPVASSTSSAAPAITTDPNGDCAIEYVYV